MTFETRAERKAFESFANWLDDLLDGGVGVDRMVVVFGVAENVLRDEVSRGWRVGSILRLIWSEKGLEMRKIAAAEFSQWADDVESGARLDCAREVLDAKDKEGIASADVAIAFDYDVWHEIYLAEEWERRSGIRPFPGESPAKYAARADRCITLTLEQGVHICDEICLNE